MNNTMIQHVTVEGNLTVNQVAPDEPQTPHPRRQYIFGAVVIVALALMYVHTPPNARGPILNIIAEIVERLARR